MNDLGRLRHMLDAAYEIRLFAENKTWGDLLTDRLLVLGLVKCIEIIGEAASKISKEYRDQHPKIAWQSIIGMRNRLIHDYAAVDLEVVWTTVTEDIPDLIAVLEELVAPEA